MKNYIAQSTKSNPKEAVLELKEKFNSCCSADNSDCCNSDAQNDAKNVKAITFFATSNYEPSELIAAMNETFPNIQVWGCTTCGEIISGCVTVNSIVAMAFTDEIIDDIKIEVVTDLKNNTSLLPTINAFEEYYQTPFAELDNKKYFGLIYIDGYSKKEEAFLDDVGNHTNVVFVGGSAGDDNKFIKTIIYANGKHYENSAVLALVKSKVKFGFEKTQSFIPTEHTVTVTKADEANRIIYELDNKPAAEVYANLLNFKAEEVVWENHFVKYTFGLIADDKQPYIRSIHQVVENNALTLFCSVPKGVELKIMEAADIVVDTRKFLEEIKKKYESISGILLFDCMGRHWALMNNNQVEEYATLFADIPTVGFKTCGEAFIGHINHTAVMLVFGR